MDRWLPIIRDMTRMQIHLAKHPEAGMLHAENWKDPQSLQTFAADQESPHLEPWRRFMRKVATSDAVGVWHETYVVPAGHSEVIYSTMPVFGLAAATSHVQIGRGTGRARERLGDAAMARTDATPR